LTGRTTRLVLIGPMGAGKSTVGALLADAWGVPLRDTDQDIEAAEGRSVADIFVESGEEYFRMREHQVVVAALHEHDGVLALGGGAVTSPASRELLVAHARRGGTVVWLDVDLPSAARRVGLSRDRPILGVNPRAMLRQMLETRAPLYDEVSTHTVPTGGREPGDVIADVAAVVHPRQVSR
jgi:shikimate kinase